MIKWGNPVEVETRRRIRLSLWAYAYEFRDEALVSDAVYDVESYQVDLNIRTTRPDLDMFFVLHFQPDTGMWIHKHPELDKVSEYYDKWA